MKIKQTSIKDLFIIEPTVFRDTRGYFLETFHNTQYEQSGIVCNFVQDNFSFSVKHVLRGLHFQMKKPQAKLVQVVSGHVYDVAVDIRPGSSTFGKWEGVHLTDRNNLQLFIPEGFAHGFCVLSNTAHFLYKCSDFYDPSDEYGILWSDPDISINWPVKNPILSEKDSKLPRLSEIFQNKQGQEEL